jgi:bifunctional non-homologous end joining protein LigD
MSVAFRELQRRVKRSVSFEPCLPRPSKEPPTGTGWIHEIKHDGFRIIAQKEGERVRLITRNGYDFTDRYGLIVDAIRSLPAKSCVIDGEAIVVDQDGLSVFELLRYRRQDHAATLCAFDLIEVDGNDLRRHPIEDRKWQLAQLLRQRHHASHSMRLTTATGRSSIATLALLAAKASCLSGAAASIARVAPTYAEDQESGRSRG